MTLNPIGKNVTELTLANGTTILFSYRTAVACHIPGLGYYRTTKAYSRTTSKHITQWLTANRAHTVHTIEPDALAKLSA